MKQLSRILPVLVVALLVLGVGSGIAMAQDVFKVNYFSNNVAGAPDSTVRIDNPGLTYGNLCAMIYVFDADQQLTPSVGLGSRGGRAVGSICWGIHRGVRTRNRGRWPSHGVVLHVLLRSDGLGKIDAISRVKETEASLVFARE